MVAERGRLLDAHAGPGAHMDLELPGVHRRKEILPQRRGEKSHRTQRKHHEQNQKHNRMVHAQREQPQVAEPHFRKA